MTAPTLGPTGLVRTVLGDVNPGGLGHTQPHEHVLSDMSSILPAAPAGDRAGEAIRLDNYDWVRRHVLNRDNLTLTDEQDAIDELQLYRAAGGGTVVDSTSIGIGRQPDGLVRVSRGSGVHIVMGCGYYVHDYQPASVAELSHDDIRDEMVADIVDGVGPNHVRAGIIGEIGLSWPVHDDECRVLRAACEAQLETGAALQIHPGRNEQAPRDALATVVEAGGIPGRTIMSHLDRTVLSLSGLLDVAATGCYLEFDLFGQESSYYAFNPAIDRPNDATRVDWLIELIGRGHLCQLLVAQDICQKVYLRRYGGTGYTHILQNIEPLMRRKGLSESDVHALTIQNPATILTFQ